MINLISDYREWTRKVTGEKLSLVEALVYVFDEPDFHHPQQVQLTFLGIGFAGSFRCSKDGSSLELRDTPACEKDLGEYGKEVIIDVSHHSSFSNYIGKTLLKVNLIFSSVEDAYIGVKLIFEGQLNLIIVNLGDEISILESLSTFYEKDEGIVYKEL